MTHKEFLSFLNSVRGYAKRFKFGHIADDIAAEAVLISLGLESGGAGASTKYLTLKAISNEAGTKNSHKRRVRASEGWDDTAETYAEDLRCDLNSFFSSLPKWKQLAFIAANDYGGPVPQGSLRRANSAAMKDLKDFVSTHYRIAFEHGRSGAIKPKLKDQMTSARAKEMHKRRQK